MRTHRPTSGHTCARNPTVVVGKEPLWTQIDGAAGQKIHVTIDATNIACTTFEDTITNDVNVTHGVLEDTVPAGWNVEEGSYSIPPDDVVIHDDGSRTLRWNVDLRAALEGSSEDPQYPSAYEPLTAIVHAGGAAPGRRAGRAARAQSDMDRDGIADAASAPCSWTSSRWARRIRTPAAVCREGGDTILLSASGSTDPEGDPLQFRWDFTGNGRLTPVVILADRRGALHGRFLPASPSSRSPTDRNVASAAAAVTIVEPASRDRTTRRPSLRRRSESKSPVRNGMISPSPSTRTVESSRP